MDDVTYVAEAQILKCVVFATIAGVAGGYTYSVFNTLIDIKLPLFFGGLIGYIWLVYISCSRKNNQTIRLACLGLIAFSLAYNQGPFLEMAMRVKPALIPYLFLGACVVSAWLSLLAIYVPQKYISYTHIMLLITLLHSPENSMHLKMITMYIITIANIQQLVENILMGNDDYIVHSMTIFFCFLRVFEECSSLYCHRYIDHLY